MNLLVPIDELADAFLYPDARPEPEDTARVREIGIGQPDVPRLIGMPLDASLPTQRRRDQGDEAIEPDPRAPA